MGQPTAEPGPMPCPTCRYDLQGTPSGPSEGSEPALTCPECGTKWTLSELRRQWEVDWPREQRGYLLAVVIPGVTAAFMIVALVTLNPTMNWGGPGVLVVLLASAAGACGGARFGLRTRRWCPRTERIIEAIAYAMIGVLANLAIIAVIVVIGAGFAAIYS